MTMKAPLACITLSLFCFLVLWAIKIFLLGAYGEMSSFGIVLAPFYLIGMVSGVIGVIWLIIRIIIKLES